MKKTVRVLCLVLSAALLLAFATACNNETGAGALQINEVASDPGAFSGPVTLVGIAYGYSKSDATIVGVMDKKELQCTTPNCNKVLLPVKVLGPLPAIGDEIRITGTFSREPGGYLFHAQEVKVLDNHQLGGQG